jgi:hypothetical protein
MEGKIQMTEWSETGIGIIYCAGLVISIAISFIVLGFLRVKKSLPAIADQKNWRFWARLFKITLLFGALTGALSVSFHGCHVDEYQHLLSSPLNTVNHGIQQVARSSEYAAWVIVAWLFFLGIYFFCRKKS